MVVRTRAAFDLDMLTLVRGVEAETTNWALFAFGSASNAMSQHDVEKAEPVCNETVIFIASMLQLYLEFLGDGI